MELPDGFEPTTCSLQVSRTTNCATGALLKMVEAEGLEPSTYRVRAGSSEPIELYFRYNKRSVGNESPNLQQYSRMLAFGRVHLGKELTVILY